MRQGSFGILTKGTEYGVLQDCPSAVAGLTESLLISAEGTAKHTARR